MHTGYVRFVAIASLVVLGLVPASAMAGQTPKRASLTGTISVLKLKKITVHGNHNLTCRIVTVSPRARGFVLGSRAKITCVRGVLSAITRPVPASSPPVVDTGTISSSGKVNADSVSGVATISALGSGSITFGAGIKCSVGSGSPSLTGFRVGSHVNYECSGGSLRSISDAS